MKESRYNVWVERGETAYVYNGVTGGLLAIPRPELDALQRLLAGADGPDCSPDTFEQLARGRMIVSDEFDELGLLAGRYAATSADTSQFALTIVTSLGCNFDCPYCFEAKHPSIMDDEVQQAVLQVLDDQLPRIDAFHVTWYGGEPLVGKEPLLALSDEFITRCGQHGIKYSADIITNGYLLDEATCLELQNRRVARAQVTLDGPPDVHDRMRPLAGGKGSFWRIVQNLRHATSYLDISVRVNVDAENFEYVEQLLQILAEENLAGKIVVAPGQLVGIVGNPGAPSASYGAGHHCFSRREFAEAELRFSALAARYGFSRPSLPRPTGAPCTAVRANELVVGSHGELYKCWDSVGNGLEVIGDIRDYRHPNGRLQKWLKYDPFANDECRGCIALPVCMGGCAHHAMEPLQYENRCGTFRNTYREQVLRFVEAAERGDLVGLVSTGELVRAMETR